MKKIFMSLTLIISLFLLVACGQTTDPNGNNDSPKPPNNDVCDFGEIPKEPEGDLKQVDRTFTGYFDTMLAVRIYVEEDFDPTPVWEALDETFRHIHQITTRFEDFSGVTNVKTLNDNRDVAHVVDEHLIQMTLLSHEYYEKTNGLFNVALGPVLDVWDYYREQCLNMGACELPSMTELESANRYVNMDNIVVDAEASTIMIKNGTTLDLGGIGKGYAAQVAGDVLKEFDEVYKFMLNAGESNIEFYGEHPIRETGEWTIRVTHPDNTNPFMADWYARIQAFTGHHVVSSGDYQRYYSVDGIDYHHIINPNTLMPGRTMRTVTMLGPDGVVGDIYATAVFLMEVDEAIAFVDSIPCYEAIIFANDGQIHFSENFEELYLLELND